MKKILATLILTLLYDLVAGNKWSYLKESERKRIEKKKEYRNVEEAKKESFDKINYKKDDLKKDTTDVEETFLKNEHLQLCRSVEEDDVKNTLLKFGLVTHLYDEVSEFRKLMKTLQDLTPKSKKKNKKSGPGRIAKADKEIIRLKGGPVVKLSQSNWIGGRSLDLISSLPRYNYNEGSNDVEVIKRKKRDSYLRTTRGRKGTLKVPVGQVPLCYGWKYLKALDALIDDENVDIEFLDQSVSDMLDMKFSVDVSSIIEDCGNAITDSGKSFCPALPEMTTLGTVTCEDQCEENRDCQYGENCCLAECGAYKCMAVKSIKSNKCEKADEFMQCLYMKIDTELCN